MDVRLKKVISIITGVILTLLALAVVFGLSGCSFISTPQPTPTQMPTSTPLPFEDWGWWNKGIDEWPTNIGNMKVCYIVVDGNAGLLVESGENDAGYPIHRFYGQRVNDRIVAKDGKILMVWAEGDKYQTYDFIANDTNDCRPFAADGGAHVYHLMEEQIVDGELLQNIEESLFIRVKSIRAEIVLP